MLTAGKLIEELQRVPPETPLLPDGEGEEGAFPSVEHCHYIYIDGGIVYIGFHLDD